MLRSIALLIIKFIIPRLFRIYIYIINISLYLNNYQKYVFEKFIEHDKWKNYRYNDSKVIINFKPTSKR